MNNPEAIARAISDKISLLSPPSADIEDEFLMAIEEALYQANVVYTAETKEILKALIEIYFEHYSGVFIS